MKKKTLALFFTYRNGLHTWQEVGSISREVRPYQELAKYFNQVYFFTYGDKKEESKYSLPENMRVFSKKWRMPSVLYSFLLPFVYRKELKEIDIIKTNQMSGSWTALIAKWLYKKKMVLRCGYEWLNVMQKEKKPKWKRILVRALSKTSYKYADRIVFTSQKDKDYAERFFSIDLKKTTVIPNYIDIELFKPEDIIKTIDVIFVGRLAREKNLPNLIKAVNDLGASLVLVGEGPKEEGLRKTAGENVLFKGRIKNEELPKELNKAKIIAMVSFYEGCPKALLEGMSCGLAPLASNVEGIREIVNEENGVLVGIEEQDLKEGLRQLLNNEKMRKELGKKARKTIEESFSLLSIIEKELKLYIGLYA